MPGDAKTAKKGIHDSTERSFGEKALNVEGQADNAARSVGLAVRGGVKLRVCLYGDDDLSDLRVSFHVSVGVDDLRKVLSMRGLKSRLATIRAPLPPVILLTRSGRFSSSVTMT
jgi:hypothetical protein